MAIVCGIDEVGYGPLLGPLVIAATAMRVPDAAVREDIWELLRNSTASAKKHLRGRLLVADSKKAYTRKSGIGHLRRTTLASLAVMNVRPSNVLELIKSLSPQTTERLGRYPWYGNLADIPLGADEELSIATSVLADDLAANGIEFLEMKCECLDVGYYNELVEKFRNKASVSFSSVCSLIYGIYTSYAGEKLHFFIDRQGGRSNYASVLSRIFTGMELSVLRETDDSSSYRLEAGNRAMVLHFCKKADGRFFPVSLASMAAKYVRS